MGSEDINSVIFRTVDSILYLLYITFLRVAYLDIKIS